MFDSSMPKLSDGFSDNDRERSRDAVPMRKQHSGDQSIKDKGVVDRIKDGGFGFIKAEVGDKEFFFHSSGMVKRGSFDLLQKGDEVSYTVGLDSRTNKEMAVDIEILGNPRANVAKKKGVIARLNPKGFGFILPDGMDHNLYFHSTHLARGVRFDQLREGDNVQYDDGFDEKAGKPWATNVQTSRRRRSIDKRERVPDVRDLLVDRPARGELSRYRGSSFAEFRRDDLSMERYQPSPRGSPASGFDRGPMGVLIGRIESKTTKGFGFIEPLKGGEPIYFHFSSMQRPGDWDDIDEGDEVSFIMGWDKKNGKKMAKGVRLLSKGTQADTSDGWLGKVTARIRSLNPKGFGFLTTGRDSIYFHSTSLFQVDFSDLSVGDDVVFTMGWDRKNKKEMAKLVEVRHNDRVNQGRENREETQLMDTEQETNAEPRSRTGHIARLSDKGFGFIKADDCADNVYFHSTGLENPEGFKELKVEDAVVFEDGWDRLKGKPMAVRVQLQAS